MFNYNCKSRIMSAADVHTHTHTCLCMRHVAFYRRQRSHTLTIIPKRLRCQRTAIKKSSPHFVGYLKAHSSSRTCAARTHARTPEKYSHPEITLHTLHSAYHCACISLRAYQQQTADAGGWVGKKSDRENYCDAMRHNALRLHWQNL